MRRTDLLWTIVGVIAALATLLAGATIWLVATSLETVVLAADDGGLVPLFGAILGVVFDALTGLLGYL